MVEAMGETSVSTHDPYALPDGLPVPIDDGACAHLEGTTMPDATLTSTDGSVVDLRVRGTAVFYVYPHTGRPGEDPPPGWNEIPGARGCTPQSCAFRDHHTELRTLGADVYGLSAQSIDEQREFAERESLPYPLLNDSAFALERLLGLPTFTVGDHRFYRRVTFVVQESTIAKVFYPVFPPDRNAEEVVTWLRHRMTGR
jgi:peroxiredoxin